jgi:hypothetical protein
LLLGSLGTMMGRRLDFLLGWTTKQTAQLKSLLGHDCFRLRPARAAFAPVVPSEYWITNERLWVPGGKKKESKKKRKRRKTKRRKERKRKNGRKKEKKGNKKELFYLFLEIMIHKFYFVYYYYIMKNRI